MPTQLISCQYFIERRWGRWPLISYTLKLLPHDVVGHVSWQFDSVLLCTLSECTTPLKNQAGCICQGCFHHAEELGLAGNSGSGAVARVWHEAPRELHQLLRAIVWERSQCEPEESLLLDARTLWTLWFCSSSRKEVAVSGCFSYITMYLIYFKHHYTLSERNAAMP